MKVIPKENSLGSRGRPGCGCRRFVPAGHEHESDQPLEQRRNRHAVLQNSRRMEVSPRPWHRLRPGQVPSDRDTALPRESSSPSPPGLLCNAARSVGEDLFPEKSLNNFKPQLIKGCCKVLANRKQGREKDTISRNPACSELALIRLTMMDALPQWLSSESLLH